MRGRIPLCSPLYIEEGKREGKEHYIYIFKRREEELFYKHKGRREEERSMPAVLFFIFILLRKEGEGRKERRRRGKWLPAAYFVPIIYVYIIILKGRRHAHPSLSSSIHHLCIFAFLVHCRWGEGSICWEGGTCSIPERSGQLSLLLPMPGDPTATLSPAAGQQANMTHLPPSPSPYLFCLSTAAMPFLPATTYLPPIGMRQ